MADPAALLPLMVGLAAFSAAVYIVLAIRLGRRAVSEDARVANHAWQAWWFLLAASSLVGSVFATMLAAADLYSLSFGLTVMMLNLILIFGALWGLSFYLAYLVTGRKSLWWPIALFYGLSALAWMYTIFEANPVGTVVEDGQAALTYAKPLTEQPLYTPLFMALLIPVLFIAGAYAYLGFRAHDRTVTFRISLVSASLIVWFGAALIASVLGLSDLSYWPVISRLVSLAAASTIYFAHFPPHAVVQRLGLRPVEESE